MESKPLTVPPALAIAQISDARAIALALLEEWDQQRTVYMETLLQELRRSSKLEPRDRRFVEELCYGIVKARYTLKAISEHFLQRGLEHYDRLLRDAVALGLYQHIYLRTPAHAVVSETVNAFQFLMTQRGARAQQLQKSSGLLNAVLRRATREITHEPVETAQLGDCETVRVRDAWARIPKLNMPARNVHLHQHLAVKYSHPPEMIRIWLERYDEVRVSEMMTWNNSAPPPTYLALRADCDAADFAGRLVAAGNDVSELLSHRMLELRSSGPIENLPGYAGGEFWVQDVNARRLSLMMPERDAATLLDLCAAPGGKLAGLLDRGSVARALACDLSDDKLRLVAENLSRLRLDAANIRCLVVPNDPDRLKIPETFNQVLVDAPCSNTGVLGRRHEARWRFVPEVLRPLHRLQRRLLSAAFRHLEPSGHLLYTTCSIEPAENEEAVADFMRQERAARLIAEQHLLPGEDRGDGGYGAVLERVKAQ
ncbi:MAG: transcription antitermination factor NusB [Planctomycetota bacterium]